LLDVATSAKGLRVVGFNPDQLFLQQLVAQQMLKSYRQQIFIQLSEMSRLLNDHQKAFGVCQK
jgi:hypothetical protein